MLFSLETAGRHQMGYNYDLNIPKLFRPHLAPYWTPVLSTNSNLLKSITFLTSKLSGYLRNRRLSRQKYYMDILGTV